MFNRGCCMGRQNMYAMPQPMTQQYTNAQPMMEGQVVEPTITKCVEQDFYHEIPHVCPIHTHTVNKHIYKHTYTPQYSCSQECQSVNLDCGKCSNFVQ